MMMMMIVVLFSLDGTPFLLPHKQFVSLLPLFGHVLNSKAWGKQKRCFSEVGFTVEGRKKQFFFFFNLVVVVVGDLILLFNVTFPARIICTLS